MNEKTSAADRLYYAIIKGNKIFEKEVARQRGMVNKPIYSYIRVCVGKESTSDSDGIPQVYVFFIRITITDSYDVKSKYV